MPARLGTDPEFRALQDRLRRAEKSLEIVVHALLNTMAYRGDPGLEFTKYIRGELMRYSVEKTENLPNKEDAQ